MKKIVVLILLVICQTGFGQNEALFNRLRAIENSGISFYNVDGINFSKQTVYLDFNDKNLRKVYRQYKIKKKDVKIKDKGIAIANYKTIQREALSDNFTSVSVYYFIKNSDNFIDVFSFGYYDKDDTDFEHRMIQLISNNDIPKSCFSPMKTDKVNFAGREIELGGNCNWMNINNVQCPYYGQMNWSVHKTKEGSDLAVQNQLKATKIRNGGKVISEEEVDITFEETRVKAKKVHYDLTGVNSLLASMSGGKNLTIYYVSAKVRDVYVSCVLSFWNNDNINPSGLPPLLEEVMRIDQK